MRPLEKKVLVTFETTTSAMAFEAEAKKAGLNGRAVPGAETDQRQDAGSATARRSGRRTGRGSWQKK